MVRGAKHDAAGEERLSVVGGARRKGVVIVEVLSVSRGNGALGALVYPFIRPMQRRFFRAQLLVIGAAAASPNSPTGTLSANF